VTSVLENNALAEKTITTRHGTFTIYIGKVEARKDGNEVHVRWLVRHNAYAIEQIRVLEWHNSFLAACGYRPEVELLHENVAQSLIAHVEVDYDKEADETLINFGFDGNQRHHKVVCWDEVNQTFDQHP
jgi:DNA-dependent RNA polymerase auxiliary subunit epsilon